MGSSEAEKAYAAFEEKIKRTIYLDTLSPQVTEPVIRSALDQFGSVTAVQFIPNYTEPTFTPFSALVELETAKQASIVVEELAACPFMTSGLPVRAKHAKEEMFEDRPERPGRKIKVCWVDPNDPEFGVSQRLKQLAKIHEAENAYLLKAQYKMMDNLLSEYYQG